MTKAFTLIELIVVIIIVGILAALGISQYSTMVEKGRGAEARTILGQMRKLAYEYYLQNGTVDGITSADLNLGSSSSQIPSGCRSTHYFYYYKSVAVSNPVFRGVAVRCMTNGKSPQWTGDPTNPVVYLDSNFAIGTDEWGRQAGMPW